MSRGNVAADVTSRGALVGDFLSALAGSTPARAELDEESLTRAHAVRIALSQRQTAEQR